LIAVLFGLSQVSGGAWSVLGRSDALASAIHGQGQIAVAQDDNDAASDDNDEADDGDNADAEDAEDADNADAEDAEDADNAAEDTTADNSSDDGGDSASNGGAPAIDDETLKQPLTAVNGTSNGGDSIVATPGERVAVRIFPWLPAGIQVTIRPVDANTVPAAPGTRAGDLTFAVEAKDANGTTLTSLPAEVNLAIRYADSTVSGLNEGNLALSRLDPSNNQWQAAPKLVREPDSNYVAASITLLGTYTVSAQ
jgi:hypothetical protein